MSHKLSILIISGGREDAGSASILAMNRLDEAIKSLGYQTLLATTPGDGMSLVKSYHGFGCVILDWDLPEKSRQLLSEGCGRYHLRYQGYG